jgi:hypothetical protein
VPARAQAGRPMACQMPTSRGEERPSHID